MLRLEQLEQWRCPTVTSINDVNQRLDRQVTPTAVFLVADHDKGATEIAAASLNRGMRRSPTSPQLSDGQARRVTGDPQYVVREA